MNSKMHKLNALLFSEKMFK